MRKVYFYFMNEKVGNPNFLIFFRIAVPLLLLIHLVSVWGDFELLYGEKAIIPWDLQNFTGHHPILLKDIVGILRGAGLSYLQSVLVFKWVFVLLCLLTTAGFFSRATAMLLLLMQISVSKSGYYFSYGVDYFTSMSLVYIILFPSDDYYSLRNFLFRRRFVPGSLTPFRRLFQIHICLAYFFSGVDKLAGFNWRNGESVWKAVNLPNFTNDFNISLTSLGQYPIVFVIAGWMTIIIELCYPLFINWRRTRRLWLILTISLHIGIFIVLNLYYFSLIMIIWNLTNYYFSDTFLSHYKKQVPEVRPVPAYQ